MVERQHFHQRSPPVMSSTSGKNKNYSGIQQNCSTFFHNEAVSAHVLSHLSGLVVKVATSCLWPERRQTWVRILVSSQKRSLVQLHLVPSFCKYEPVRPDTSHRLMVREQYSQQQKLCSFSARKLFTCPYYFF